jgi:AraC family transcriptional regulator
MEMNLDKPLGLRDIAGAACLSRSYFAYMFRLSTGSSAMAYLYRLRIERAKAMLVQGSVPLGELAAALGFSHHSHFTRVFRRHTGLSPRAFRRRYGEDWLANEDIPPDFPASDWAGFRQGMPERLAVRVGRTLPA